MPLGTHYTKKYIKLNNYKRYIFFVDQNKKNPDKTMVKNMQISSEKYEASGLPQSDIHILPFTKMNMKILKGHIHCYSH